MPRKLRWVAAAVAAAASMATTPPAAASAFGVSLVVEAPGSPPTGSPPTLAFTGFPLLVLLAVLAILLTAGLLLTATGRERAGTDAGRGN